MPNSRTSSHGARNRANGDLESATPGNHAHIAIRRPTERSVDALTSAVRPDVHPHLDDCILQVGVRNVAPELGAIRPEPRSRRPGSIYSVVDEAGSARPARRSTAWALIGRHSLNLLGTSSVNGRSSSPMRPTGSIGPCIGLPSAACVLAESGEKDCANHPTSLSMSNAHE